MKPASGTTLRLRPRPPTTPIPAGRTARILRSCLSHAALLATLLPAPATAIDVGLSTVGSRLFENQVLPTHAATQTDLFGAALATGDFNGDGVDDLATGIPYANGLPNQPVSDVGAVLIRYGALGLGLGDAPAPIVLNQSGASVDLGEPADLFGATLAAGNFNGDAYDDLAVGAPDNNAPGIGHTGGVFIYYGAAGGLQSAAEQFVDQSTPDLPLIGGSVAQRSGDRFGAALAVGNFNGDGYADLAIGAPGDDYCGESCSEGVGSVTLLYGGLAGLVPVGEEDLVLSQLGAQLPDNAEGGDNFGFSLAAGNFNGDQGEFGNEFDDLAIGVPGEDGQGAVLVVFGGSAGLEPSLNVWWGQGDVGGIGELNDRFGHALAAGDFDGDGSDDLAIGDPYEDLTGADAGELTILQGTDLSEETPIPQLLYARKWFDRNRTDHLTQGSIFGSTAYDQAGDSFAGTLASGDFNHDGFADLAVGISGEDVGGTDRGGVAVLTGRATTGLVHLFRFLASGISGVPGPPQDFQYMGGALATGDFDGDGHADLAIGVPFRDVDGLGSAAGAAIVLDGTLFSDGFANGNTFEWTFTEP